MENNNTQQPAGSAYQTANEAYTTPNAQQPEGYSPYNVPTPPNKPPKCTCCGYIGPWKVEPLFRPMDWVIGILLLFLFGTGIIYFLVVGLIRSNKDRRDKICPNCNARNLWSFLY